MQKLERVHTFIHHPANDEGGWLTITVVGGTGSPRPDSDKYLMRLTECTYKFLYSYVIYERLGFSHTKQWSFHNAAVRVDIKEIRVPCRV